MKTKEVILGGLFIKEKFKALWIIEEAEETYRKSIVSKTMDDLPEGDVCIQVHYSSLNYKDALSASGNKGVTRHYPHTPGIDAAGKVVTSVDPRFSPGDQVIVTGYDLGMNTAGGYSQMIRVPGDWLLPCPEELSLKESMAMGTAGFTAALSIYQMIEAGIKPEDGEILVTGATGGVGSITVRILNKLGYKVIAATGKIEEKDHLLEIGARGIIFRDKIIDGSGRALLASRWAGVVDTVGGDILATALKSTKYGGCVTCCGNVANHDFTTSVYPFILRGIRLIGIDSVQCPMALRKALWQLLAKEWKVMPSMAMLNEVSLLELPDAIDDILQGRHVGRTIVNLLEMRPKG